MATSGHESESINVSGLKATIKDAGNIGLFNEATCSTAAGTAAKTVTSPTSFTLTTGATIVVKFTNAITVASATLAVGSNAAKAIYYRGAALAKNMVKAGDRLILKYNGTQFDIIGHLDTDTNTQAVSSVVGKTGAVTAAQIGDALTSAGYKLTDTTYSAATQSANGLMSSSDKTKLDGVATGANNYSLPTASSSTLGGVKVGTNLSISNGVLSATDTTYSSKTAASGGTDVSLVTTGEKYTWNNKGSYSKPSGGIPKTDLASAVQTSLGKADSALQSHQTVTDSNPTLSWGAKSKVATIGSTGINVTMPANPNTDTKVIVEGVDPTSASWYYIPLSSSTSSSIATTLVAPSDGFDVNILKGSTSVVGGAKLRLGNSTAAGTAGNKKAQIIMYGNRSYSATLEYVDGATANSTHTFPATGGTVLNSGTSSVSKSGETLTVKINGTEKSLTNTTYSSQSAASGGTAVSLCTTGEKYTWNNKQAALVSGTNIKTVNGESILGSGNIEIQGGGGGEVVTINLTANTDSSAIIGATVKIKDNTEGGYLLQTTWQGSEISFEVPVPVNYTVEFGGVTNYQTPSNVTYNSRTGRSRSVSAQYKTEVVTVTVNTCNAGVSAQGQTVTIAGTNYTVPSNGVVSRKVAFGTSYSVSVNDKTSYRTPATQSFTANSVSRSVTMTYVDYVDFGLSSGLKWAIMNVGATSETGYGSYFSWGNVTPSTSFSFTIYQNSNAYNIGENDDITPGSSTYDGVRVNMGSPWKMPTSENFQELLDATDVEAATINGINCIKLMKKTNHSVYILFPLGGCYNGASYTEATTPMQVGKSGAFWTVSNNKQTMPMKEMQYSYMLSCSNSDGTVAAGVGSNMRPTGQNLRGVK